MRTDEYKGLIRGMAQECLVLRATRDWGMICPDGFPAVKRGDVLVFGWGWNVINMRNGCQVRYPVSQMTFVRKVLVPAPLFEADFRRTAIQAGIPQTIE